MRNINANVNDDKVLQKARTLYAIILQGLSFLHFLFFAKLCKKRNETIGFYIKRNCTFQDYITSLSNMRAEYDLPLF